MKNLPTYKDRAILPMLKKYLTIFPAIGITGPRQSGKSTMLVNQLSNYNYVTFDDPVNVERFNDDPKGFLQQYSDKTIFDEVQYVPEIFRYLKIEIDKNRNSYGNFILTCSSQFQFLNNASESLAGRIGLITLLPFGYEELPLIDKKPAIFQGSYPEIVTRNYLESESWYANYIATYLNKDVRNLSNIGDISDFNRLIKLLAANVAQILDMSEYAKEIGVSVPTIKRWISLLEASYIIFLLPPFYKNLASRVIKRPKIYFHDTGLVSYLTGIKTWEQYNQGPLAGSLFENYIISEIIKKEKHHGGTSDFYFVRTSDKTEVDLVIDKGTKLEFIEIKKSATFKNKMLFALKKFMGPEDVGYLVYNGENYPEAQNIKIINYQDFLLR